MRIAGAVAARQLGKLNGPATTAILVGVRDPNDQVAEACYWSLAITETPLTKFHELMLTSLEFAIDHGAIAVRKAAAALAARLKERPYDKRLGSRLDAVLHRFRNDVSYLVRETVAPAKVNLSG